MAYIVPIETPKSCHDCYFCNLIEQHPFWSSEKDKQGTKTYRCQVHAERRTITLDIHDKTTKADWCPLKEMVGDTE